MTHAVHGRRAQTHGRRSTLLHRRHPPPGAPRLSGTTGQQWLLRRRRRPLHGQADHVFAAQQDQSQCPLFGALFNDGAAGFGKAKFLRLAQHQVQVLVKGQKGPDNVATVVQRHPQSVFNVFQEFASFSSGLRMIKTRRMGNNGLAITTVVRSFLNNIFYCTSQGIRKILLREEAILLKLVWHRRCDARDKDKPLAGIFIQE